jgi:hypothetical protein
MKMSWINKLFVVYQMATTEIGEDMMSPKTVAAEGHNSDGRFGDITDEPL